MYSTNSGSRSYRDVWTTKNFDGTTFRDGTPIPEKPTFSEWVNFGAPAWCYPNGNISNNPEYGKLYNWYAAAGYMGIDQPTKQLAPYGWKVPNEYEYSNLYRGVYYSTGSGGNAEEYPKWWREIGTKHWNTDVTNPGSYSNNILGFTAFAAGRRSNEAGGNNGFEDFGTAAFFYLAYVRNINIQTLPFPFPPIYSANRSYYYVTNYNAVLAQPDGNPNNRVGGCSVRFVKENMNTPGVYGRPLIQYLGVWDYDTVLANG